MTGRPILRPISDTGTHTDSDIAIAYAVQVGQRCNSITGQGLGFLLLLHHATMSDVGKDSRMGLMGGP